MVFKNVRLFTFRANDIRSLRRQVKPLQTLWVGSRLDWVFFYIKWLRGGGFGDLRTIIFEEAVNFGDVLRFEVRIFDSGFVEIGDVLAGAVTEGSFFYANVPIMVFFFHFVALILDAELLLFAFLRFEAICDFSSFGS